MSTQVIEAIILDDEQSLTLVELSKACNVHAEWVLELVDEGIIDPLQQDSLHYHFPSTCLRKALTVKHLQHDLGINLAGAALVLDLKQEIDRLRSHVTLLKCELNK